MPESLKLTLEWVRMKSLQISFLLVLICWSNKTPKMSVLYCSTPCLILVHKEQEGWKWTLGRRHCWRGLCQSEYQAPTVQQSVQTGRSHLHLVVRFASKSWRHNACVGARLVFGSEQNVCTSSLFCFRRTLHGLMVSKSPTLRFTRKSCKICWTRRSRAKTCISEKTTKETHVSEFSICFPRSCCFVWDKMFVSWESLVLGGNLTSALCCSGDRSLWGWMRQCRRSDVLPGTRLALQAHGIHSDERTVQQITHHFHCLRWYVTCSSFVRVKTADKSMQ